MALAISGTSPATVAGAPNPATWGMTTASFTPPADSLLVAMLAANTPINSDILPTPSIVSSAGVTWTLGQMAGYSLPAGSPSHVNGFAAIWTAPVAVSAAMTVTTFADVGGTPASDQALTVLVLTDTFQPAVGASTEGWQSSGTAVPMTFTATGTGSWGFGVYCDRDHKGTPTAGTGTTLINGGTDTGQFSYGFFRRTTADGVNTSATTVNGVLPLASTNLQWSAIEILPGVRSVVRYLDQLRATRDTIAKILGTDASLGTVQLRALSDADLTCVAAVMKALVDKGTLTDADLLAAQATAVTESNSWQYLPPLP